MVVAGALTFGLGAGCRVLPFNKAGGAIHPALAVGGYATVSQCPSFATYQARVDAVFQRACTACHAAGGKGAGYFQMTAGDPANNDLAAGNFYASRAEAVPETVSVDSSNPDQSSPLLQRLNGSLSHDLTLDIGGDDYATIRGWVVEEVTQTCVIGADGTITVGGS